VRVGHDRFYHSGTGRVAHGTPSPAGLALLGVLVWIIRRSRPYGTSTTARGSSPTRRPRNSAPHSGGCSGPSAATPGSVSGVSSPSPRRCSRTGCGLLVGAYIQQSDKGQERTRRSAASLRIPGATEHPRPTRPPPEPLPGHASVEPDRGRTPGRRHTPSGPAPTGGRNLTSHPLSVLRNATSGQPDRAPLQPIQVGNLRVSPQRRPGGRLPARDQPPQVRGRRGRSVGPPSRPSNGQQPNAAEVSNYGRLPTLGA
jgi:hypothetical protein